MSGGGSAGHKSLMLLENARNVITVRDVVQDAYHNFMPAYQVKQCTSGAAFGQKGDHS